MDSLVLIFTMEHHQSWWMCQPWDIFEESLVLQPVVLFVTSLKMLNNVQELGFGKCKWVDRRASVGKNSDAYLNRGLLGLPVASSPLPGGEREGMRVLYGSNLLNTCWMPHT